VENRTAHRNAIGGYLIQIGQRKLENKEQSCLSEAACSFTMCRQLLIATGNASYTDKRRLCAVQIEHGHIRGFIKSGNHILQEF